MSSISSVGKVALVLAVALSSGAASAASLEFKPSTTQADASCRYPTWGDEHPLSLDGWRKDDVDYSAQFTCNITIYRDLGANEGGHQYQTLFSITQTFNPDRVAFDQRSAQMNSIAQYLNSVVSSAQDQGRFVKVNPLVDNIDDGNKVLTMGQGMSDAQLVGDVVVTGSALNQAPQVAAAATSTGVQNKIYINTDGAGAASSSQATASASSKLQ